MEGSARTALVVGGTRGIGRSCARRLSDAGHRVIIVGRRAEGVRAAVEAEAARGRVMEGRVCDISSTTQREEWLGPGGDLRLDDVDIAVLAAGAATSARFERTTSDDMQTQFGMHALAPHLIAARVLPGMRERGWGRFIFIGSLSSLAGYPYTAAYAASKHALLGVMRALSAEIAGTGVTANAVCPGYVDTDMTDALIDRLAARTSSSPDAVRRSLEAATAGGRFLSADEVAGAVTFFAGEDARAINGQVLVVDGGGMQH